MGANLQINGEDMCNTDKNNTACGQRKEGNQIIFTLKITTEHKYRCLVYRSTPIPVQTRKGKEIKFSPGETYESCLENKLCLLY